jgi:hypothetical protein
MPFFLTAYSRLGDSHEAEDVAQEVFVKEWYNLTKLQEASKFGSWLMSIARNTATDFTLKLKPTVGLEDAVLAGSAENFTEAKRLVNASRQKQFADFQRSKNRRKTRLVRQGTMVYHRLHTYLCLHGLLVTPMIPNEEGTFLSRERKNTIYPYSHKGFKLISRCES